MTGSSNKASVDRRLFIGGSDARIIMSADEAALIRLWREKRGESEPEDLSDNLIVQLGVATEDAEPELVRTEHWACRNRRPTLGSTPGPSISGRYAGRVRQRPRRRV